MTATMLLLSKFLLLKFRTAAQCPISVDPRACTTKRDGSQFLLLLRQLGAYTSVQIEIAEIV